MSMKHAVSGSAGGGGTIQRGRMSSIEFLMDAARQAAGMLGRELPALRRVAFVTSSYDTAFEPVAGQVRARIMQLRDAYGTGGPLSWSLWVVDDLGEDSIFSTAVQDGFSCEPVLLRQGRVRLVPLGSGAARPGGVKGKALRDGMAAALAEPGGQDALVYINLNLKVDAVLSAPGLATVLAGASDVAIGTRARRDGGVVVGAGAAGRAKSIAWNLLVRAMLPELAGWYDTNAPVKIFTPAAARHLIDRARIDSVSMDAEWLLLMQRAGFRLSRFPVAWVQRQGSRPPWHLVTGCFRDVLAIRKRFTRGHSDLTGN